ncbi:hypothetical protein H257_16492 [Aphanomyces astaci]|uniref:Uncharacterized protein n=1 Tax=Aphanomyces astaci TaxID=112090 RepID=W4FK88_APHAT|nr:hypothetical protein H257_16492 [Aphanomyces astaci]ETV67249.1 hypothetical protein H257_16492 [Aphanomyces astaci]|eukprot:XP_009843237.1 hypothetical protein H257_16492 [Aphanomyces astaci]
MTSCGRLKCMVDGCGVVVWYTYFKVHMTKDHPEIPQYRNIRKRYGRQVDANDKVLEDEGVADLHPDDADEDYAFSPPTTPVSLPSSTPVTPFEFIRSFK